MPKLAQVNFLPTLNCGATSGVRRLYYFITLGGPKHPAAKAEMTIG